MFAVTGVSGRVGGHTAQRLIEAGHQVRVILRDLKKGDRFANLGCEVAVADIRNVSALTKALSGVEACFFMMPPLFDPSPEFAEAREFASALKSAASTLPLSTRIVVLSTIGAQVRRQNLLSQLAILEAEFSSVPNPVVFLRPAWFLENSAIDVEDARRTGVIRSFLQPLDKPVPMVATEDVGAVAASLLQQEWTGHRVVELEGPHRVTPREIASMFSLVLGHLVRAEAVPRSSWKDKFRREGMLNPVPRIAMLDGFNEGWIEFEHAEPSLKGCVSVETVIRDLVHVRSGERAFSADQVARG